MIAFLVTGFRKIIMLFVIISSIFNIAAKAQEGYNIKLKINGLKDTSVILAHYFAKTNSFYPDDTASLDKKGIGAFKGKEKLPGGMYIVLLPSKSYFDIMIDDDQNFSLETDTSDLVKNLVVQESYVTSNFLNYQLFLMDKSKIAQKIQGEFNGVKEEAKKEELNAQLKSLDSSVQDYLNEVILSNKNNLIGIFCKATKRIEVPDPPKDAKGHITDSTFQYRYYKQHYFDNFDYTDSRLLRTPLYEDNILRYINKVILQVPDTIMKEADIILDKVKPNEEIFRYLLITLFNQYATSKIMGMDAVYIHLAEKYYIPYAHWSDEKFINDLKERVAKAKGTIIGNVAPDFEIVEIPTEHFIQAENDTALKRYPYVGNTYHIHDLQAKYTVLVFWECDCGHCKKEIPELYKLYEEELKDMGVKIFAIHMLGGEEGKEKWIDFINKHQLYDWINAWNPYDYTYKKLYDILSTPAIFVLDKNKTIIAKKIGPEQVVEVIKFKENQANKL